jgi:hypothetical protein
MFCLELNFRMTAFVLSAKQSKFVENELCAQQIFGRNSLSEEFIYQEDSSWRFAEFGMVI